MIIKISLIGLNEGYVFVKLIFFSSRSIMKACIENLSSVGIDSANSRDLRTLFHKLELIWHLCEVLFIDVQSRKSSKIFSIKIHVRRAAG